MIGKDRDILQSFTQGRNTNLKYFKSVQKVFAEFSLFGFCRQILIGRCYNSHVNLACRLLTYFFNLSVLEYAEQLCLCGQGQFAYFIQKYGAAISQFKFSLLILHGPGEATLFMSEKSAFYQRFGDSCTIYFYIRFRGTIAA